MPEIIPAIIPKSFDELKAKIKLVEPYACSEPSRGIKTVQMDIMDGVFVLNKTWPYAAPTQRVAALNGLESSINLEAHLMVQNPEEVLDDWLKSPVKRIILHWEALSKIFNFPRPRQACPAKRDERGGQFFPASPRLGRGRAIFNFIKEAHNVNKEFGVALNLETPITVLDNFISGIDLVLLMSVNPGFTGQEFLPAAIDKIKALRRKYPHVKIEVDGGINLANAKEIIEAGADFLAVGSAIFESKNIGETIKKFKSISNK